MDAHCSEDSPIAADFKTCTAVAYFEVYSLRRYVRHMDGAVVRSFFTITAVLSGTYDTNAANGFPGTGQTRDKNLSCHDLNLSKIVSVGYAVTAVVDYACKGIPNNLAVARHTHVASLAKPDNSPLPCWHYL